MHNPRIESVQFGGTEDCLRVWVGCIKLDNKFPRRSTIRDMLYNSPDNDATDADVIALFFTDLEITENTAKSLRHRLKKALKNQEDYILNEDDGALPIRQTFLRHHFWFDAKCVCLLQACSSCAVLIQGVVRAG